MIKGAAGAAVQNFNLMYGFAETTALLYNPRTFPAIDPRSSGQLSKR